MRSHKSRLASDVEGIRSPTHYFGGHGPAKGGTAAPPLQILPSLGRQSSSRRRGAILRQTAIGQKNRPSTPAADSAQVRCIRYAESLVTARASRVARST